MGALSFRQKGIKNWQAPYETDFGNLFNSNPIVGVTTLGAYPLAQKILGAMGNVASATVTPDDRTVSERINDNVAPIAERTSQDLAGYANGTEGKLFKSPAPEPVTSISQNQSAGQQKPALSLGSVGLAKMGPSDLPKSLDITGGVSTTPPAQQNIGMFSTDGKPMTRVALGSGMNEGVVKPDSNIPATQFASSPGGNTVILGNGAQNFRPTAGGPADPDWSPGSANALATANDAQYNAEVARARNAEAIDKKFEESKNVAQRLADIQSNNRTWDMDPAVQLRAAQASFDADKAKALGEQKLTGEKYTADQGLSAHKYTADQGLAGHKYTADQELAGAKYKADDAVEVAKIKTNNEALKIGQKNKENSAKDVKDALRSMGLATTAENVNKVTAHNNNLTNYAQSVVGFVNAIGQNNPNAQQYFDALRDPKHPNHNDVMAIFQKSKFGKGYAAYPTLDYSKLTQGKNSNVLPNVEEES